MKAYRRKLGKCPLEVTGKLSADEKAYAKLAKLIPKADPWDCVDNNWIRAGTWSLIDERARLQQNGELGNGIARRMSRKIKASLKEDRVERAQKVGEAVSVHLAKGEVKKAWKCVQGWYRKLTGQQQKQCHEAMEKQTIEREALYAKVPPPGDRIPCNVPTTNIDDEAPKDEEIRPVVVAAKNGKAKGIDMVQTENIKTWMWKMMVEEGYEVDAQIEEEETGVPRDPDKPLKGAGGGDQWRKFVEIIKSIWRTGVIPRHLLRAIIVLIPKGNRGDFRGIGLMQPM